LIHGQIMRKDPFFRLLSVVCVFLVGFIGFIQAVHVHSGNSKLPSHDCSICSVAHSGVIAKALYRPVPVFVSAVLLVPTDAVPKSSGFVSSFHIRPPPSV